MWQIFKRIAPHLSTAVTVISIMAAGMVWVANTWAKDLVSGLVDDRIGRLEEQARDMKQNDIIQTFKLKSIQDDQADIKDAQREINRDIKAILQKLSEK